MDPYVTSTPNSTKLPILDTGKFEQWKFRIQQYLQHEHYALWEVIEFGDSYRAPAQDKSVSGEATPSSRSKGRTVAVTAEDMQKRRNDVKARTTLLLALPDEHQLRFSKYETAKELWEAILRTFGGNEATKKTKKNLLKQQYGNFKAEGSETLEQTFNRLQAIVSQLEFLDVPVEQEDLNQKFLTSLSPEWLMHTIVWRNRNDLDTMSLDDLYNHLKVYESEVQKKGGSSSQNMAFISSSNTNSGKSEVPTAQSFSTASGQVTTAGLIRSPNNYDIELCDDNKVSVKAIKPKAVHNGAVKGNRFSVIKASACRVWMPKKQSYRRSYLKQTYDAEIQGRHKHEQEEITTAGAEISNASPEVKIASDSIEDIAAETLVYIRRSATKAKDKAVRLQAELDKEERQRISRAQGLIQELLQKIFI
ncbi:hypothetical protein Tco_0547680 [Tanacetum coccineum]